MSWNYRIIRHTDTITREEYYELIECYYNDDGSLMGYTEYPSPDGGTVEELQESYKMMAEAFTKPVLNPSDFPEAVVNDLLE